MKIPIISFLLLLITTFAIGQPLRQGEWKAYTAMNVVNDVALTSDSLRVWVATDGGAFRMELADLHPESFKNLRTSDGLSAIEISAVATDNNNNIYFGGRNGSFDIYNESSGSVKKIQDIALSTLVTKKNIYGITINGAKVFIAAGYGISIYNTTSNSFSETVTKFGDLSVEDTAFSAMEYNGKIYVVTSGAIAIADANSANLSAPFAWQIINAPPAALLRTQAIFGGKLVVGGLGGLFTLNLSTFTLDNVILTDSISCKRLVVQGGKLYALDMYNGGRLATSSDLVNVSFTPVAFSSSQSQPSSFARTGIGDIVYGFTAGGTTYIPGNSSPIYDLYSPGPLTNLASNLYYSGSEQKLYSVFGTSGLSVFDMSGSRWIGYSTAGNSQMPKTDYKNVFYDSTRNVLWLSCGGLGIVKAQFNGDAISFSVKDINSGLPSSDASGNNFIVAGQGILDRKGDMAFSIWAYNGEALSKTSDGNSFTNTQMNTPGGLFRSYGTIAQDLDGYYYIGTISHNNPPTYGVVYVTPDGTTGGIPGGTTGTISNSNVNALIVDQDNGLWCGTNVGIDIVSHFRTGVSGTTEFRARKVPFVDQQLVKSIAVDGVGNKWVATENGVFVVSADGADSIAHYTKSNSPLLDNSVVSISMDTKNGEVYIATAKGISRTSSIFKQGGADYSGMYVYPNPLIQSEFEKPVMTITGLVNSSTVKIYTISGRLITTIDGTLLGSTVTWDGRDENGKDLASGVYLVSATSALTEESGQTKFVLVRKK
jgi:hypothetical protein